MPVITANGEPVKIGGPGDAYTEYDFQLTGNSVLIAREKGNAKDPYGPAKRLRKGDRGTLKREENETLYAFNDDLEGDGSDADLSLDKAGFSLSFGTRYVVGAVQTSSGNEASPANDDDDFEPGSVDLDADGDQTLSLNGVDAADNFTGLVEFGNDGHVEVHYLDADGNRLTSRTPAENGDYSVTGGGDVYVEPAIASPHIEVDIIDDTAAGTANNTAWTVYLR